MSTVVDIGTDTYEDAQVRRDASTDTTDLTTALLDTEGKGVRESGTSAANILRGALGRRKVNFEHRQSYINPHYVPAEDIVRMGERLPAEYIVHTDTWTETNMKYLLEIADKCGEAAIRHDKEQKHFKGKHTTLTVPSMFLAATASLVAGFGANQSSNTLSIASAVLAAASGFSQSVINYHEWNIRSNKHGSSAVRFGGLAEHIRALQHLHEERRRSYEVESVYVLMTLAGIMHEEPPLPDSPSTLCQKLCFLW